MENTLLKGRLRILAAAAIGCLRTGKRRVAEKAAGFL
jgi:hypothetical protein